MMTKTPPAAGAGMRLLRTIHRTVTFFVVAFTLYLAVTGTLIQGVDLRSILTRAPADDANVLAMREAHNGPGYFQVMISRDYAGETLPVGADLEAMMTTVVKSARQAAGGKPLAYAELRMANSQAVGQVAIKAKPANELLLFDAATGAALGSAPKVSADEYGSPKAARNTFKRLHRMTTFGDPALVINVVVGIALATLIVTGLLIYWNLYKGRAQRGQAGVFWSAGGIWRSLHRAISLVCAVFLTVLMLSGMWLAVESAGKAIYVARYSTVDADGKRRNPVVPDTATPLTDTEMPAMLSTTLAGYRTIAPGGQIKVIRLRHFGGMAQGVVVTGGEGVKVRQLVFNAATGERVSLTEPGYPKTGFPFGWQAHQIAKDVHSGEFFGLPGRLMNLIAGIAMLYLSVSGIVIYADLLSRRRKRGDKALLWT